METGICLLSVIPVREKPSDKSQMVNQLLFGETVKIIDRLNNWLLIESSGNRYKGWADSNQIRWIDEDTYDALEKDTPVYLVDPYLKVNSTEGPVLLSFGSRLPFFNQNGFQIDGIQYSFEAKPETQHGKKSEEELALLAQKFLGIPYLWGGRSYFGIDCSGFSELIFKTCGYQPPRDSSEQAEVGKTISFINEARAADLAFFENEEEQIVHVGILLNNTQIIHASNSVRIDSIDHEGIFNVSQQKYTHKLRIIKRILT